LSEPFGLTPLEAISFKTPSLVTNRSGVSEVFKNCLRVDFWDIDEMRSYIIASSIKSDELLNELTEKAYEEYKIMSWDDSANRLHQLYQHHKKPSEVEI
jgi:glycosyltransferase involved in cell wall biosynthesis